MKKTYKTKTKEYIIDFLSNHKNKRFSVKEIYDSILEQDKSINITTIYRNIQSLQNEGLLLKHQSNDNDYATYQYIENSTCLAHFHFECKKCGKVVHLGAKETNDFLRMIKVRMQFSVEPQNTYITGICNNCKGVLLEI